MDNLESLLDDLEKFEKKSCPDEIPETLEEYLHYVAKTGDPVFPWHRVKPLIRHKLVNVMAAFCGLFGGEEIIESTNLPPFSYNPSRNKILDQFDTFNGAPFTIQRLCEILINPMRHYKRTDNFLRALEKNILVVSCVEPGRSKPTTDIDHQNLVNGMQEGTTSFSSMSTGSTTTTHSNKRASRHNSCLGNNLNEVTEDGDTEEGSAGAHTPNGANEESSSSSSSSSCSSSASSSPVPDEDLSDASSSKRSHMDVEDEGESTSCQKKPRRASPHRTSPRNAPREPGGEAPHSRDAQMEEECEEDHRKGDVEEEGVKDSNKSDAEAECKKQKTWSPKKDEDVIDEEVGTTHPIKSEKKASLKEAHTEEVVSSVNSTLWQGAVQENACEEVSSQKSSPDSAEDSLCESALSPHSSQVEKESGSEATAAWSEKEEPEMQRLQEEDDATTDAQVESTEQDRAPSPEGEADSTSSQSQGRETPLPISLAPVNDASSLMPPESSSPPLQPHSSQLESSSPPRDRNHEPQEENSEDSCSSSNSNQEESRQLESD